MNPNWDKVITETIKALKPNFIDHGLGEMDLGKLEEFWREEFEEIRKKKRENTRRGRKDDDNNLVLEFEIELDNDDDFPFHTGEGDVFAIPQFDDEQNDAFAIPQSDGYNYYTSDEDDKDLVTVGGSIAGSSIPALVLVSHGHEENIQGAAAAQEPREELDPAVDGFGNALGLEKEIGSDDDASDFELNDEAEANWQNCDSVHCVLKKLTRSRDLWKFELTNGILNIGGKELSFTKAIGQAKW